MRKYDVNHWEPNGYEGWSRRFRESRLEAARVVYNPTMEHQNLPYMWCIWADPHVGSNSTKDGRSPTELAARDAADAALLVSGLKPRR